MSRGVQAFLSCVASDRCLQWLLFIGHVYLAGGCLWQRQEKSAEKDVIAGIVEWSKAKQDPKPISVLVVSHADSSVLFEGSYSPTRSGKSHRVDYGCLSIQLRDYVREQYVLNVAGHSEVLRFAWTVLNHFHEHKSWLQTEPDCQSNEIDWALLAVGKTYENTVAPQTSTERGKSTLFSATTICLRRIISIYRALIS